jgi:hypothetical protein
MLRDHAIQCKQTIAVAHRSSVDSYMKGTYAAAVTGIAARVEPVDSLEDRPDGGERKSRWLVITATEVKRDSRVWLPPDDLDTPLQAAKARIPFEVIKRVDVAGNATHFEVSL